MKSTISHILPLNDEPVPSKGVEGESIIVFETELCVRLYTWEFGYGMGEGWYCHDTQDGYPFRLDTSVLAAWIWVTGLPHRCNRSR